MTERRRVNKYPLSLSLTDIKINSKTYNKRKSFKSSHESGRKELNKRRGEEEKRNGGRREGRE